MTQQQPPTPSAQKLIKSLIGIAIVLLVIFGSIFGFSAYINHEKTTAMSSFQRKPQEVSATTVKKESWQPTIDVTGKAHAIQQTNVTPQNSGIVQEIDFKSGDIVKQGDVLLKLRTNELKTQLKKAKTQYELANITYQRNQTLLEQQAISKEQYDRSLAQRNVAQAEVATIKAKIDNSTIVAPFSGRIGLRQVNLGQFVQPGTPIATVSKINPINIRFDVVQQAIQYIESGNQIEFSIDGIPDQHFSAPITAINSAISPSTLGLSVQATYDKNTPDQDHLITPGMIVNVHILLPKIQDALVIPRNAISYTLFGENVYVLKRKQQNGEPMNVVYDKAENGQIKQVKTDKPLYEAKQVPIQVTHVRGNLAVVTGIKQGDLIVTDGQNKLSQGMNVMVNNKVQLGQSNSKTQSSS